MIADNRIWFGKDGNSRPAPKRFLSEVRQGIVASAWWPFAEVGHNDESKKELQKLFDGRSPFETPKPTRLVRRMLEVVVAPGSGDIVVDFFAGSGTTGDAIMQANCATKGTARFILVQLPESIWDGSYPTIASITQERLRRAGSSLNKEYPGTSADFGFRVYKLDSGNVQPWAASKDTLRAALTAAVDHVKRDRTEDDLLYDIILKHGLELCAVIEQKQIGGHKVSSVGGGAVFACFGSRITAADVEQLADGIAKWRDELAPANPELSRVVFRDSAFETDVAKTNLALILKERGFDEKLVVSL
jgi:adenine-specific DNA-methyltransferase